MSKYITEFVGTFLLVLTIGCAVIPGRPGPVAAIAIGTVLVSLVYAGGHVSGAHYNPAVTLALLLRRRCAPRDVAPYCLGQLGGAVAAAVAAGFLVGRGTPIDLATTSRVLAAEALFTFALVWVILNVGTAAATRGNGYYGVAIGAVVAAGILAVGDVSGAAFNPAVALGAGLMGIVEISRIWAHVAAQLVAAVVAVAVFRAGSPTDR